MNGVTGLSDGHRFGCHAWQRDDAPEHQHLDISAAWNGGALQEHTTSAQTTHYPRPNSTPTCAFGNAEAHNRALHRHRADTDHLSEAPASNVTQEASFIVAFENLAVRKSPTTIKALR